MLNKRERHHVLVCLHYFYTAGLFPVEVNLNSWEICPGIKSGWKKLASQVSFGIFCAHALYKMGSLVHAFAFLGGTPLYQLVIHMTLAGTSAMTLFWYYVLYLKFSSINAAFVTTTLTATAAGSDVPEHAINGDEESRWTRRMMQYSLQDLIGIFMPYMVLPAIPIISACFVYDPTLRLLLYAGLPESFKTWPWFWVCFIEELHFLTMFASIATPAWQIQVISFDLVNTSLQTIVSYNLRRRPQVSLKAEQSYKSLRCLQLYTITLNNVNRNLIFTWKLLCIGAGIISGYAAIAHFNEHPIFGVMYYFILFDVTVIYILIYGKAFKTPDLFKAAVQETLLRLGKERQLGDHLQRKILIRQIRSIPSMGVQVGRFHTLEPTSTPIFVHYVLNNIVSMLVAFG